MKTPEKRGSLRRKQLRIIGLDPGLAFTGWGILDFINGKIKYVNHGTIKTKPDIPHSIRLFHIMKSLQEVIKIYKPSEAAIEILFFGRNAKSAIPVAEARGVISAVLAKNGITIHEFAPNAIKKGVTGQGDADKKTVQEMVRILLKLDKPPKPEHAADALAAAICVLNNSLYL